MKTKEKTYTEFTPIGKTYWNDEGVYQTEFNELYKYLVPNCGDAPTIQGELLRVISRLNYDYFNNGNCNVQEVIEEDCYVCGGSGWEKSDYDDEEEVDCSSCGGNCTWETGVEITEYYQRMIDFLKQYSNAQNEINNLVKFLTDCYHYRKPNLFAEKNGHFYTKLIDKVMQQILTDGKDANKPNPEFNEKAQNRKKHNAQY